MSLKSPSIYRPLNFSDLFSLPQRLLANKARKAMDRIVFVLKLSPENLAELSQILFREKALIDQEINPST